MESKPMKTKLKKDDTVLVIAGKDKGKTGRILRLDRENGRVFVEGLNLDNKAQKRRNQNDSCGIVEIEAPVDISNVMYVAKDGKPTRIGVRVEGGRRVRYAKRTGEAI